MTKPFADYDWEIGVQQARHNPTRICYLIGVPSAKRADSKNTGHQGKSWWVTRHFSAHDSQVPCTGKPYLCFLKPPRGEPSVSATIT